MCKIKGFFSFQIAILFLLSAVSFSYGQSGVFDRVGIIPGHGLQGSLPEENIDLFTGNVTLRYRDIFLPGPNGLNVEVWRVYNSKIYKDRQTGQPESIQAWHQSWVGMGWTMHMGMVHQETSDTPVIEFPDGRRETAYPDNYGVNKHIIRDFLRYDKSAHKLYFKNGIIWTFGHESEITLWDGGTDPVRMVTRIEDSFGYHIDIVYVLSLPIISTITDAYGRVIGFESSVEAGPRRLISISFRNEKGEWAERLHYSVLGHTPGPYALASFTRPELSPTSFEYNSSHELKKITESYGGVLEYSYENHVFFFNGIELNSRVVTQKKITFNPGETYIWNYSYPDYNGATTGTASIVGPEYDVHATYHGYDPTCPWKLGLISALQLGDGSYSETYDWTYQEISNYIWSVLLTNMGTAKAPIISSTTKIKAGNSTLKEENIYDGNLPAKRYGLPCQISYYINGASSPINYKTISYYFQASSAYGDKFMLDFPYIEKEYSGSGELLGGKKTLYYEETGKWGAIKRVSTLKDGSTYCDWDYVYQYNDSIGLIQVIRIGPLGSHTTTSYYYGVDQSKTVGDTEFYSFTISNYISRPTSALTRDGAAISFTYDNLGRILTEDWPTDRNDRNTNWPEGENKAVITRGANRVTKYWDGMGRETGFTEKNEEDGKILYHRKRLSAEGRTLAVNPGCLTADSLIPDTGDKWTHYTFNAAGDVTQSIDPEGRTTNTTYAGITKSVTDPNGHTTSYEYNHLPGLPTKITDAQGHDFIYSYDGVGRLTNAVFNGQRTYSYEYDLRDNLTAETCPETGRIQYTYSDENWLTQKSWGGAVITYIYTTIDGRLFKTQSGDGTTIDEEITYIYNLHSRITRVESTKGWKRKLILYDDYGNVTSETITIPGLPDKTITYTYDLNNNLKRTTYPDGNWVEVTSNGLNRPKTLAFNNIDNLLVSAASYGQNKATTGLTLARNGTQYSAAYDNSGRLTTENLIKGQSSLYNATYSYDGVGNILGIMSTAPVEVMNGSFTYDSLDRLITAHYTSGRVADFAYNYDEYGNMTSVQEHTQEGTRTVFSENYNSSNRIINDNNYSYDSRGNVNLVDSKTLSWDYHNQLDHITNSSGEVLAKYLYDERGLRIRAVPPLPEMKIYCGETPISNGGGLEFDCISAGQHVDKTLTIKNLGDANLNLTGSPKVAITGADAGQFTVLEQPTSPVSPSGSVTFTIRFSPTSVGNKTAVMSIANDDPVESPYQITLMGNLIPEMNIIGVASGGTWNFGNVPVGEMADKAFTIQNLGCGSLVLSGNPRVAISGDKYAQFSVTQEPDATILPGSTSSFIVEFDALRRGTFTAMLSITNNDPDENPYIIYLSATGVSSSAETANKSSVLTSILRGPRAENNVTDNYNIQRNILLRTGEEKIMPAASNQFNGELITSNPYAIGGASETASVRTRLAGAHIIAAKININSGGRGNRAESNSNTYKQPTEMGQPSAIKESNKLTDKALDPASGSRAGSYYIYGYDGRLIAEYDVHGTCIKDYVYMKERLIAEYNAVSSQYYYYTQDQINSTRILTDDSGSVVFAEAYDPYGGIQKTWVNTYEPKREYSDKERDEESGFDYFGARYYLNSIYRWLSIDPVTNKTNAPFNPSQWNLYAFCINNPLRYHDSDGRTEEEIIMALPTF